jgi:hypothetical protein
MQQPFHTCLETLYFLKMSLKCIIHVSAYVAIIKCYQSCFGETAVRAHLIYLVLL